MGIVGVTGATGKIGRWLVRELIDRGHRVRAMVRPTRAGFWGDTGAAVAELAGWGCEIVEADFADTASLTRFVAGLAVLVHNGYHHCDEEKHPVEWTRMNILGSVELYEAFRVAGGRQILFISSGAVYGRGPTHESERFGVVPPIDERTARAPRGLYAAYKACIEDATVAFKTVNGPLPGSTSLRPLGDGVGELCGLRRYDAVGLFADQARRLLAGEAVSLALPPRVVCIDGLDLGAACAFLIDRDAGGGAIDDWYHVGNAPVSRERVAELFAEAFGRAPTIVPAPGEALRSTARMAALGWRGRGSEATLRDHLTELAAKLRAPARSARA